MARAPLVAVLAAGLAIRFGGGKLDAACAGRPVGQWVLDAVLAAGLGGADDPGLIVCGHQPPGFALAAPGWRLLANPAPERGLGSSLALAAAAARARGRDLFVLLADMPLIDPAYLRWLAGLAGASGAQGAAAVGAAATLYPDGGIGVPARLPLGVLGDFAALGESGGESGGGAALLRGVPGLVLGRPEAGMLADIDTPADLARAAIVLAAREARAEPPGDAERA